MEYNMEFKKPPTSTPQGALSRLWRNIILDNKLEQSLSYLVSRYITKHGGDSKNLKRKTKATLSADITSTEMTWKKFSNLVFNYLGAVKMDVSIKLTFASGTTSTHNVVMVSSNIENDKEKTDDVH